MSSQPELSELARMLQALANSPDLQTELTKLVQPQQQPATTPTEPEDNGSIPEFLALKSCHGQFMSVNATNRMWCRSVKAGERETFRLMPINENKKEYALVGANGLMTCVEPGFLLTCDRQFQGPWEVFTLEFSSPNVVAFKSHLNTYLSAQPNGRMEADRSVQDIWERFTVIPMPDPAGKQAGIKPAEDVAQPEHPFCHAAVCDVCNKMIRGIRYKCVNCADFDLCEECEEKNTTEELHDKDHVFMKLRRGIPCHFTPLAVFPTVSSGRRFGGCGRGRFNRFHVRANPRVAACQSSLDGFPEQWKTLQELGLDEYPTLALNLLNKNNGDVACVIPLLKRRKVREAERCARRAAKKAAYEAAAQEIRNKRAAPAVAETEPAGQTTEPLVEQYPFLFHGLMRKHNGNMGLAIADLHKHRAHEAARAGVSTPQKCVQPATATATASASASAEERLEKLEQDIGRLTELIMARVQNQ